uniref:Phospholipase A2 group III n=1 Tax=Podarcis muralis TaxID=64176 RepID=A0A670JI98_PODMU
VQWTLCSFSVYKQGFLISAFSLAGVFQGPDVCCREHDMCEAQISALGYKFGMRNFRLHTISHCECDERCKEYGLKPLARLVEQSQYHAALPYVESSSPVTPPPPPRRHWGKGRKHGSVTRPILTSKPDRIAHFPVPQSRSCSCYRRLDQCPYRIGPNEVKYQLHNVDSRTLFHCNCTRR